MTYSRITTEPDGLDLKVSQSAIGLGEALDQELKYYAERWNKIAIITIYPLLLSEKYWAV